MLIQGIGSMYSTCNSARLVSRVVGKTLQQEIAAKIKTKVIVYTLKLKVVENYAKYNMKNEKPVDCCVSFQ